MRKVILFIISIICISVVFIACNNQDTYADKLKKEGKEINRFLNDSDIKVLDNYPGDNYKFKDNEYYLHPSGTYIRIDNWGDENKKADRGTNVTMRASGRFLGDTVQYSNFGQSAIHYYISYTYKHEDTYMGSYNAQTGGEYFKYILMSVGCALPLEYVGNQGEVSLIVPFINGSVAQQSNYKALYFDRVRYTIDK